MKMELRAQRLLEELHDVRDAAASLPDALVLLDAHGGVRWCNRSAERLLALARRLVSEDGLTTENTEGTEDSSTFAPVAPVHSVAPFRDA